MSKSAAAGCALDSRNCVSLDRILQSFGAPVSEEQAWALCYAFGVCYSEVVKGRRAKIYVVNNLKHVIIHKDGFIQHETFLPGGEKCKGRSRASKEGKLVSELGVVLFHALDYSLASDEERDLSPNLHRLIDLMATAESERGETDDEGIERDSGESEDEYQNGTAFTMQEALKLCKDRLLAEGVSQGVDEHYKAVVRALVAEAVDLTTFLKKVSDNSKLVTFNSDLFSSEQDLNQLQSEDWSRLWKQVMQQLRDGVKLKKVDYTKTPLEYALTPYEMLMEDIRSRRFTLNKVMINGDLPPRVKKDAHTIILDFIRSRPPLRKACDRQLAPLRKTSSPMELLMDSIKSRDHRLKHVASPTRPRPVSFIEKSTHIPASQAISPQPKKKLISAPRLILSAEDEDDDDDLSDVPPSSPRLMHTPQFSGSNPRTHASLTSSPQTPTEKGPISSPLSRVAYDLANYGSSNMPGRRHSISICETPLAGPPSGADTPNGSSGPPSRGSSSYGTPPQHQMLASTSKTQRDFLSSAHFSSRLDCLSLTLEEVVHIRNVLTKADLEALPLDLSIKEDVSKGKICFLCMKTRFTFFGQKSRECKLCKRMVCKKCVTKMRIPTEHFSNIPVIMLTPQALSPKDEEDEPASISKTFINMLQSKLFFKWTEPVLTEKVDSVARWNNLHHMTVSNLDLPRGQYGTIERKNSGGSVGSAPSSPTSHRSHLSLGPSSLQSPAPFVTHDIKKGGRLKRYNTFSQFDANNNNGEDQTGFYSLRKKKSVTRKLSLHNRASKSTSIFQNFISKVSSSMMSPRTQTQYENYDEATNLYWIRKQEIRQRNQEMEERIRGELMCVCLDCKAMVIHVLLSIKLRRDQHEAQTPSDPARGHLHLNLTPVYN